MRGKLNERLTRQQSPFVFSAVCTSIICVLAFLVRAHVEGRWTCPEQFKRDILYLAVFVGIFVTSVLLLVIPQHTSIIVLIFRFFLCIFICYGNYLRFHGKESGSFEVQLKYQREIYAVKNEIIYLYI